jgi:hypothetical protein
MITEQTLRNYIEKLGHIPASASICLDKISKLLSSRSSLPLNTELQFYVNPQNLCWFADEEFLAVNKYNDIVNELLFTTNVRDIKLSEIL